MSHSITEARNISLPCCSSCCRSTSAAARAGAWPRRLPPQHLQHHARPNAHSRLRGHAPLLHVALALRPRMPDAERIRVAPLARQAPSLARRLTAAYPHSHGAARGTLGALLPAAQFVLPAAQFALRQHTPAYVSIRQHTSAYLQAVVARVALDALQSCPPSGRDLCLRVQTFYRPVVKRQVLPPCSLCS